MKTWERIKSHLVKPRGDCVLCGPGECENTSRMEHMVKLAQKVEGIMDNSPNDARVQQAALRTRHALFAAFEAMDVPFAPYWTSALPLAKPRTQLERYLCMRLEPEVDTPDA